ncbi:28S ribosomal protein S23, mitochondrial [Cololabis saira]|uniref:28S ribosomal protein S23, mitochondrial n=1 Tax=Cololabis saira TaxID=129043 RepID=UPI002AD59E80|nr:28S ribosomal protein S23, mitochondrial [Cololabis saira]
MAGSRLERVGTVFTRVRDLMRSGVMKRSQKPLWYDVYEAFPPKRDPVHVRPLGRPLPSRLENVPEIFYREDAVRARFYEQYGTGPRPFDLSRSNFVSTCQRFVNKYTELEKQSDLDQQVLFLETAKALLAEGVVLKRRTALPVEESREPALELNPSDVAAEQSPADSQQK